MWSRLLGAVVLAAGVLSGAPAVAAPANEAPPVAPALRQWSGGTGEFVLSPRTRIVLPDHRLADEAGVFAKDLARITGRVLPVIPFGQPRSGDIVLTLDRAAPEHREGYSLDIGDKMVLSAREDTGISRGTQTIEQSFSLNGAIPRGKALDWPRLAERGFMIDAGRKYWEPAYLEQQIRTAAWYKYNSVHLHFSETEAFRLDSPKFPGLAAEQAYTKADIARFESVAAKYHVTLLPEIDLPGHAGVLTNYRPETKWSCESMTQKPYPANLNTTRRASRDFVKELLDEFIPWFSGPEFHVGADETPGQSNLEQCPELVSYAAEKGFANVADVNVDFINHMDSIVKAHGKRTVIWNWWEVKAHSWKPNLSPTIHPHRDIKVEVWWNSELPYLDMGYDVVSSPYRGLYVTPGAPPGGGTAPNTKTLYGQWEPIAHPRLTGYRLSRWTDRSTTEPDDYHDWFAHRPQQVLADRAWGGPRQGTQLDYENRLDRIGGPPAVTLGFAAIRPGAAPVMGAPYGTGSGHEKAFDGDPTTFFEDPLPDGGYTGFDAGRAVRIGKVRFVPRSADVVHLKRMIGGRFQGCSAGPDQGCVDLATITWRPPGHDWLQLPVDDPRPYRWLRYLSPDGGFTNVAEIEFRAARR